MKHRLHLLITLATIGPLTVWSLVSFLRTVRRDDLAGTLLTISLTQVHYLLVLVACVILLHELSDAAITKHILQQELFVFAPRRGKLFFLRSLPWWASALTLAVFGLFIPFIDLLGSFGFNALHPEKLAPKIALLLLSGIYIYHAVDRPLAYRKNLKAMLEQTGAMQVLSRADDHNFMARALDEVPSGQQVFVTHFEEPRNPMHPDGYYYESDFMRKWYDTVRTKQLEVCQIVLVNSTQDIADLERRLELTKDIPSFSIACIVAPRLTIFMDFMVMPNRFALLGFSDDLTVRNMNEFSLVITSGPALGRFEHLFTDVLLPEAVHIKTFEGVDGAALNRVKSQAQAIAKSPARILRDLFHFA